MAFTLGRYELLIRLGQGGGANVFLARDLESTPRPRLIALKVLLPRLASNPESLRAFFTEGDIAARLDHPHIVAIHGFGEAGGIYALAMEYVFGDSLGGILHRSYMKRKPLSVGVVLTIAQKICDALDHAHRLTDDQGRAMALVHRDISPENILVGFDGVPKLADFGIAKALNRGWETGVGIVKGKSRYLAPEQVFGRRLDHRADIFALGIVLWESVTGRILFQGPTLADTFQAIRTAKVTPPSELVEGLHPVVDEIVMKALCRNPAQRFQTAGQMRDRIEQLLGGSGAGFDDSRIAREMVAIYGDLLASRALALRAAVDGKVEVEELARVFNGEPIHLDQIPDAARAAHLLVRADAVGQPEPEPQERMPARTEHLVRGMPELDALGEVTLHTEEAPIDEVEALMALEPEKPESISPPELTVVGGWKMGVDANDAPIYMLLSEGDIDAGRLSPEFTQQLGLTQDELTALDPLDGNTIADLASPFVDDGQNTDFDDDGQKTDIGPAPSVPPPVASRPPPKPQPSPVVDGDPSTEIDGQVLVIERDPAPQSGIRMEPKLVLAAAVVLVLLGMIGGYALAVLSGRA